MRKICLICLMSAAVGHAHAQLKGTHLLGDAGLKSGSQAPPSVSAALPLYFYHAGSLRNDNGDKIGGDPDIGMFLAGVGMSWVSNLKILGANYGNSLMVGFAQNRIEGNELDVNSPFAFTDMYVQPVQLGWSTPRADFTFSYSLYLPTGRWELGADDNSGLGTLSNEFAIGTTLYFDQRKTTHFSALASYAINSKKKDTDIRTGDVLSLEGGLGKTFMKLAPDSKTPVALFSFGPVYYMQFKMTDDDISVNGTAYEGNRDYLFGVGAEAGLVLPRSGLVFNARWVGELGARNRFQGQTLLVTLAYAIGTERIRPKRSASE